MILNVRRFFLLICLATLPCAALGDTSSGPFDFVMMSIVGTLAQSSDGQVIPSDGDIISAVNNSTNQIVGQGTYSSVTGTYSLLLTPPTSSNGIMFSLRINHANNTYNLLKVGSQDSNMRLVGVPFPGPPPQNNIPVIIGAAINSGSSGPVTPPPPSTALPGDVNGDGKIDDADIQTLKQAISGGSAIDKKAMDINGDGSVNTGDLITLIRAVRAQSAIPVPASILPAPASSIIPSHAPIRP